jgi:hypothetical protein
MPVAVAPASRGHNVFSNAFRGRIRNRAASEVGAQPPPARGPEAPQMTKAASYTYFPRVEDLDTPPLVELKGTISAEELQLQQSSHGEGTSDSSGGSSPSSEDAPEIEAVEMPQLRPSNLSRRSSRFLPFSSRSREPSTERKSDRKADRGRKEEIKQTESPSTVHVKTSKKVVDRVRIKATEILVLAIAREARCEEGGGDKEEPGGQQAKDTKRQHHQHS